MDAGSPIVMHLAMISAAYLLGSLPTAYLLVRLVRGEDIRTIASGNVGATNTGRVLGLGGFLLVFAIDALKGAAPVAAGLTVPWSAAGAAWLGAVAVVGHCYPAWLDFRGGKGVATAAGAFAVVAPWAAAFGLAAWALGMAATRKGSVGSLAGLVVAMAAVIGWGPAGVGLPLGAIAALIVWRHRDNFQRLREGKEHGFGR